MSTTLGDFTVLSTLGAGTYGTCKKIKRKVDGKEFAWKEIKYGSLRSLQSTLNEIIILKEVRHQHIVRCFGHILDKASQKVFIFMELCTGRDLKLRIEINRNTGTHFCEQFSWKMMNQLALAIEFCHTRPNGTSIIHRDIKPANVFLDEQSNVKLGDFGLATTLHPESRFSMMPVGTPSYMSPEIVSKKPYDETTDIWSFGCLLFELCSLRKLFTGSTHSEIERQIMAAIVPRIPCLYSENLNTTIKSMIQVDASTRPTFQHIYQAYADARKLVPLLDHSQSQGGGDQSLSCQPRQKDTEISKLAKRKRPGYTGSTKSNHDTASEKKKKMKKDQ